jgi:hypothetical protein
MLPHELLPDGAAFELLLVIASPELLHVGAAPELEDISVGGVAASGCSLASFSPPRQRQHFAP